MSKRSEAKDIEETPVQVVEAIAEQERFRAVDLARELGYMPEMVASGSRANPVTVNQRAWLYRAAMLRFRFDGETQMGRQEFIEHIKAIEAL